MKPLKRSSPVPLLARKFQKACELYRELIDERQPVDWWLGNFFHRYRQYGSHDRKMLSEALYASFRHRLFAETWAKAFSIKPRSADWFDLVVLFSMVREGLLSESEAREIAQSASLRVDWPDRWFYLLSERQFPPSFVSQSPQEMLSLRYSFPLWLVERWDIQFGLKETELLCQALNERPPLVVRVNSLKTSREKLLGQLARAGHDVSPTTLSPFGIVFEKRINVFELKEFREGLFEVQDEGSQLIGLVVDPKPDEVVWDVCAGGGGKTLLLAALMQNKGRLVATDIRARKLQELKRRLKRAGVFNVFCPDLAWLSRSSVIRRGVDRMLIDAPCSGTGTFRRNPDAKWKVNEEKLKAFQQEQVQILETYATYLKKGGFLFYATCSLEPIENEEVIRLFLKSHPEFRSLPLGSETADFQYQKLLASDGTLRLYPHQHGTDGFFLAALQRA